MLFYIKKLCYRRRTARRAVPVEIWLTAAHSCTTNPEQIEITELGGYTIDLPWRNFLSPEFGTKFQRKVPFVLAVPEFPYNIV